jgi:alanine racemase
MLRTFNEIAIALGHKTFDSDAKIESLMIDSRAVTKPSTTAFIALRSPNNDGHRYIPQLIEAGVSCFIVDNVDERYAARTDLRFIVVDDTLAALQRLGAACRRQFHGSVIAITGSRGKTMLKEMLYQALHRVTKVSRSPRSYNSRIGVPLSLWQLDNDADVAIIEAGISRRGEMDSLSSIIDPQIGVLTNITEEHADGFDSRDEKIAEKIKLFANCDIIVYAADDADVVKAITNVYPDKKLIKTKPDYRHLAIATLGALGYDRDKASTLLANTVAVKTRLNVIEGVNNCKLIFDEFTTDMLSLTGALDFMNRRVPEGLHRTLILATDSFIDDDNRLQDAVKAYGLDRIILVGKKSLDIKAPIVQRFATIDQLTKQLTANEFSNEVILLKGAPSDGLNTVYSMLEAKQHETVLEVNLDAIISNFNMFRSKVKPTTGVICMLKAHGYGAGSIELARTLQAQGAAYIAVAVVDEGIELRQAGITMPIMVLNPRAQNHKMMFDYRLEPEIYSFAMLDEVIENARRYGVSDFPIHIKLETGMRRLGFVEEDMQQLGQRLNATNLVKASTLFSHLACADDPAQDDYTRSQFDSFARSCDALDAQLSYKPRRHILNSTGILRFPQMQYDFVRLGIGLYGVPTLFDGSEAGLRNVSTLSSVVISIKHWKAGDTVGYNRRGLLDHDATIATIPIGYADGLDRHLGYGNASLIINGHKCPTVGSICMDICMVDVTGIDCNVGDRVEIFGETVTPVQLAETLGTIPYEILTSISPRVKRVYYRE